MRNRCHFLLPLRNRFGIVSGILLGLSGSHAAAQVPEPAATLQISLAAIEKLVEAKRVELHIPGVALAIVKDDKVILLKGFGQRDIVKGLPVDADTLFGIASSTKAFTAMAAAIAADEGKLSLDDSPKKYLPYFHLKDPDADAKVTLRDLLANRSGLGMANMPLLFSDKLTRAETIQLMGSVQPSAKLRAAWQYQNIMFAAAGETVAAAEGSTWEKDIAGRIFQPLGMASSNTSLKELRAARNRTLGYTYNADTRETKDATLVDLNSTAPDGAINSTARDMARWLRLMLGGGAIDGKRLVSEKNFAELIKPQIAIGGGMSYGLGWFLKQWRGAKIVEHGGNLPGFSTEVSMMPDKQLGVVLLMNVYSSPLGEIVKEAVWSNLSGIPEPARPAAATAVANAPAAKPANPAAEAGTYKFKEMNAEVTVTFDKDHLAFQLPGNPLLNLDSVEGRRYQVAAPAPPGLFVTFRPSADETGELLFETPQGKFVMARIKPFVSPITVEELMAKVIAAMGGEKNLRSHTSRETTYTSQYLNQGITGAGVERNKAPNMEIMTEVLSGLGKQLGTYSDYFDGESGGTSGLGPADIYTGAKLEAKRIQSDFYAPLNWKTNFKTVVITGMTKVANEDVYVVEKTPRIGDKTVEYISAATFLLLQTKSTRPVGDSGMKLEFTTRFEDYRETGGIKMAFRTVGNTAVSGETVMQIESVKFDLDIPNAVFKAPKR